MSLTKSLVLLAGAAIGLASTAAIADQPATAPAQQDEIRAIVAEMLADAETRSSLLAAGATSGNDGNFFIASPDGNYRLNVGGDIQARYYLNFRDKDQTVNGGNNFDDFDSGFQMGNVRVRFFGNIINPDWTYKIQLNAGNGRYSPDIDSETNQVVPSSSSSDNGFALLEDAWIAYNFGNGWSGKAGQFKLPLLHEELVDSTQQLFVTRSILNEAFSQGYSQGVQIAYTDIDWNAKAAFSDGLRTANTDYTEFTNDWAITSRFEYKFAGQWQDFDDFNAKPGQPFAAMLGLAGNFQQSKNTAAPTDVDIQSITYTADFSIYGDGWTGYAAFVGNYAAFLNTAPDTNIYTNNYGVLVQGGYRWSNSEVFAGWTGLMPDNDLLAESKDIYNFLQIGFSQFYAGNAAKATVDMVWALDQTSDLSAGSATNPFATLFPDTNIGLLGSSKANEVTVRFQFQLVF
ncbi:MAG: hypothetical protein KF745_12390 [Phycisphaeraceae bacterium]|nr:hypothetical protein [Phycisphaeraceae bacterium]